MVNNSENLQKEETAALNTQILNVKNMTKIGYWNVRTMSVPTKLAQVVNEMNN